MLRKILLLVLSAMLLVGCAGKPSGSQSESNEVQITATDFAFKSSRTEFKVGVPYHFVVTNAGQVAHELMIMAPIQEMSGMPMDMEELDKMALAHVAAEELPPGATVSFDYTFTQPYPAGQLEFACHVPGHYEAGMKLEIVVNP